MEEYEYGYFALRIVLKKALEHLEKGNIEKAKSYLEEMAFVESEMEKIHAEKSMQDR